jgi:hypothetical protein
MENDSKGKALGHKKAMWGRINPIKSFNGDPFTQHLKESLWDKSMLKQPTHNSFPKARE